MICVVSIHLLTALTRARAPLLQQNLYNKLLHFRDYSWTLLEFL